MRSTVLFSVLLASTAQGFLVPPKVNRTNPIDWKLEQKRQALGALTWLVGMELKHMAESIRLLTMLRQGR